MSSQRFDSIVIGQGLAGTALAWHLIGRGQRVCVIDDDHRSSSSKVAAGLINPLAGMRFNRPPRTLDWLDYAADWYDRLALELGEPLFHPRPMLRLFRSRQQQRFYERRQADKDSATLLGERFNADACPEALIAPFGGFIQERTGHVDLPRLLQLTAAKLKHDGALHHGYVDPDRVEPLPGGVRYGGISAQRLIFCDGARLRTNAWFEYLPLRPVKGQILDVDLGNWRSAHIINGAHWLLPSPNDPSRFRFGATHEHAFADDNPGPAARATLLDGLAALGPGTGAVSVLKEQAGIRPATADRQPLIGSHPQVPALTVFNGFGARGALTIPWYADRLAAHLVEGHPLPAEADITRFPCPHA